MKITYHRNPTRAEISIGYGATHYRDFDLSEVKTGRKTAWGADIPKRWLVAEDDGLRYYL